MGPDGVLRAARADGAAAVADAVAALEPEAVAVVPAARLPPPRRTSGAIGDALRERLPDVHVSLSHEVVGTFREYERAATTEVDAALSPLLARLPAPPARRAPREAGLPEPAIMQSSGGLADARRPPPTTPR